MTKTRKNKIFKVLTIILINILLILILLTNYINTAFSNVSFEQLLYSLNTAEGTGEGIVENGIIYIIPRLLILNFIWFLLLFLKRKYLKQVIYLKISIKAKSFTIALNYLSKWVKRILIIIFTLGSLFYTLYGIGLINYILFNINDTHLFDKYYVDPAKVKISAPKEKNNLIYIYVESLETSLFSKENGGGFNKSVIPNLEKLAKENINFSATNKLGGAYMYTGTHWTIAGIVASSSGIPLKISTTDGTVYYNYNGSFLPGAYSLGEVLEKNGYKNYFMLGSSARFGGRNLYFTEHGNYKIIDYNYAVKKKWIDSDYHVWWGYEDKKLYDFAKKQLQKISSSDEPFNFTLLTADTHFVDGYLDETCDTNFDQRYLNVYNCTDKMLGEFISWIKKQDFYENTTIVIVGDHLTMQSNMEDMFDTNTDRYVYNTIINSKKDVKKYSNRDFSSMDMYPTVLSALGFEIKGERLGLGTNLFSNKKTLSEKLTVDKYAEEISHKSNYYNSKIIKEGFMLDN